jgi:hypothetical protein
MYENNFASGIDLRAGYYIFEYNMYAGTTDVMANLHM